MFHKLLVVEKQDRTWKFTVQPTTEPIWIGPGSPYARRARTQPFARWLNTQIQAPGSALRKELVSLAWRYLNGEDIVLVTPQGEATDGIELASQIRQLAREIARSLEPEYSPGSSCLPASSG